MSRHGPASRDVTVRGRMEWIDTDAAGIHHHTTITRFAESAEAELMRQLDLPDYFGSAPRVRFEVSYEAPLRFGQQVTTVLRVERVGNSSLALSFEVWGEEFAGRQRERAAAGRYVTVHVTGGIAGPEGKKPRSTPWPEGWFPSAWRQGGARPHPPGPAQWPR
jgi:acyl-CoA thioester hydrolase